MNYHYMKVFYTVCKYQNLSKAAIDLDVTQPAVSRIISSIEEEFHTKLFTRSKNGVTLTREGVSLYEMIKNPLIELEKIEDSLNKDKSLNISTIHIGATATALDCLVFKYLAKAKSMYPSINFKIYTSSSKKLLEMLDNNAIDFAFITSPFQIGNDIEVHNVHKINNILIAPMIYKDQLKGKLSIKQLEDYPFVLLNNNMQFREHVNEFLAKHKTKIVPIYETDSSGQLLAFVENNCGLTFIPEEMAEKSIKDGTCFKVDLIEKMPLRYVTFAIKKNNSHSNAILELKEGILRLAI